MNKTDFLSQLEQNLLRLSKADRDDILLDYEEHLRACMYKDMSEEEAVASLGDPAVIASKFLENLPLDAKGACAQPAAAQSSFTGGADNGAQNNAAPVTPTTDAGGIAIVIILSIFVYLPVAWTIVGIWLSVCGAALGSAIGAIALIGGSFFSLSSPLAFAGLLLIGIALAAFSALMVILAVESVKWIISLCKLVWKFSRKLVYGQL